MPTEFEGLWNRWMPRSNSVVLRLFLAHSSADREVMRHAGRFGFKHLLLSLLDLVLTKQLTCVIPLGRDKDEGGEKRRNGKGRRKGWCNWRKKLKKELEKQECLRRLNSQPPFFFFFSWTRTIKRLAESLVRTLKELSSWNKPPPPKKWAWVHFTFWDCAAFLSASTSPHCRDIHLFFWTWNIKVSWEPPKHQTPCRRLPGSWFCLLWTYGEAKDVGAVVVVTGPDERKMENSFTRKPQTEWAIYHIHNGWLWKLESLAFAFPQKYFIKKCVWIVFLSSKCSFTSRCCF